MSLKPFIAIVRKDLLLHVGNRRALIITLLIPIVIASFFGGMFGGQSGKTKATGVSVQIVNHDQSPTAQEIIAALKADEMLKVTEVDEATARSGIRNGKVTTAVIIPEKFSDQAGRSFFGPNAKPELTILHDPSRNMEASMVKGVLMQHIMESVSKNIFSTANGAAMAREALTNLDSAIGLASEDTRILRNLLGSVDTWLSRTSTNTSSSKAAGGGGFSMPFKVKDEESVEKTPDSPLNHYNGFAHSFGGMSMQFLLMAAIDWGLAILLERQRGLWRRLRAAPLSKGTLLGGRLASSSIIGFGTLATCWAFSMLVFNVRVNGSWLGFLACNASLAIFAASLGLLIAAIGRTPEATRGIAILVILLMVMLGGAWIPAFIFPEWVQKATLIVPTRWAMDGFDAMTWRGLDFSAVWGAIGVLLGYAAVCSLLAHRLFKWEAD